MDVPVSDVTVVVCAYTMERWDDMVAALRSARTQEPRPSEVVLVIDHNDDLLRRARVELEGVTVVESTGRRGLSGARNTGVATASSAIVAFLDDDAVAQPGWLAALVAPYSDSSVLGTGGAALAAWDRGRPAWFPEEFGWVVGCSYRGQPEVVAAVRNPLGCSMSFRRSVFEAVGGFRPEIGRVGSLPVGCEETEFCIRAREEYPESRILHIPSSQVRHRVPARRATLSYYFSRCYSEGRSKAIVASVVGARAGLSAERAHTLRTLPRGVATNVRSVFRGDPWGAARAAAIVTGLAMTTLGFIVGTLSARLGLSSPLDRDAVQRFR